MSTIHCLKCDTSEDFITYQKTGEECPFCNKSRVVLKICDKCNILFVSTYEKQSTCEQNNCKPNAIYRFIQNCISYI